MHIPLTLRLGAPLRLLATAGALVLALSNGVMAAPPRVPAPPRAAHGTDRAPVDPATPAQLAEAMGIPAADLVSATITTSDPTGVGIGTQPLGRFFPRQGPTFAILATGAAATAATANTDGSTSGTLTGLDNSQDNDMVQLRLVLRPPPGATCLQFDFAFYSEEFPEFVGSEFNDFFLAEVGGSSFVINANNTVTAPLNFAFDPLGRVISVNTVFGVSANTQSTYDGVTPILRAVAPLGPAAFPQIEIVLTITDLGDSIYDSAVFLDNFAWVVGGACSAGAVLADAVLSPNTGLIGLEDEFDVVFFEPKPILRRTVKVNDLDVSALVDQCIPGVRTDAAGTTRRCPGFSGTGMLDLFAQPPWLIDVTLDFLDGTSTSEVVVWDIPSSNPPPFAILFPSGFYASTQRFPFMLLFAGGIPAITGGSATLDGADVSGGVLSCLGRSPVEALATVNGSPLWSALRCPISGGAFAPGPHALSVTLQLADGTSLISSVSWTIRGNVE